MKKRKGKRGKEKKKEGESLIKYQSRSFIPFVHEEDKKGGLLASQFSKVVVM